MKPRTEKPLRLDPNEAPKGYVAVLANGPYDCDNCAANGTDARTGLCHKLTDEKGGVSCSSFGRADRCEVNFVKAPKKPRPKATFARWWKKKQPVCKDKYGIRILSFKEAEALARRAYAAGRRAAAKRSISQIIRARLRPR